MLCTDLVASGWETGGCAIATVNATGSARPSPVQVREVETSGRVKDKSKRHATWRRKRRYPLHKCPKVRENPARKTGDGALGEVGVGIDPLGATTTPTAYLTDASGARALVDGNTRSVPV